MDETYTIIDNNIFHDKDLNMQQAFVFMAIISYYNKQKGYAYPSYAKLKDRAKISDDRTLIKAIKYLEENGYIRREIRKGIGIKYYILGKYSNCKNTVPVNLQDVPTVELQDVPTVILQDDPLENYSTTNTNTNTNKQILITNTKERIKKEKGGINALIESYTDNTDLKECIKDFIKMRTAKKKPVTDRALKMLLDKLDSLETSNERKIKVLEQSILNSWQGIFPLKEENQGGNQDGSSSNIQDDKGPFNLW